MLMYARGSDNMSHSIDLDFTAKENADIYGSLVDITVLGHFGSFDSDKIRKALSKSKLFRSIALSLNIAEMTRAMKSSFFIGYPQGYLNLPPDLLHELSVGEIKGIQALMSHTYRVQPSLCQPENNVLILLCWSSMVQSPHHQRLSEWATSNDGRALYRQMCDSILGSQTLLQFSLTLSGLLCYQKLLPSLSEDSLQPSTGYYLADFNELLKGKCLGNERTVYSRMVFSFLRAFDSLNEYQKVPQFLVTALDENTPGLHILDGISDAYWLCRIQERLDHRDAFIMTQQQLSTTWSKWLTADGEN
ncbi:hypothetical protein B0O99DRAFT_577815 [Bisporella sp. PMI_857]|nr:hypothetical protein B0O99DRAFT_577815 [Bisporella sp. PMI_857]